MSTYLVYPQVSNWGPITVEADEVGHENDWSTNTNLVVFKLSGEEVAVFNKDDLIGWQVQLEHDRGCVPQDLDVCVAESGRSTFDSATYRARTAHPTVS